MSYPAEVPLFTYKKKQTGNKNKIRVTERQKLEFAKFLQTRIPFAIPFKGDEELEELQKTLRKYGPNRPAESWINSWNTYTDDIEKKLREGMHPDDLSNAKHEIYKVMVACQKFHEKEADFEAAELSQHSDLGKKNCGRTQNSKPQKSQELDSDIEIFDDSEVESPNVANDINPSDSDEMDSDNDVSSKMRADTRYKPLSTEENHRQSALLAMQRKVAGLQSSENNVVCDASDPLVAGLSSMVKKGKSSSILQVGTEFESLQEKMIDLQMQFDELSKVADEDIQAIKDTISKIKEIMNNIPNLTRGSVRVKLRELLANLQKDAANNKFILPVPVVNHQS